MFYLTKLMSSRLFFFEDRPPFDMPSWDIFARSAAMFGSHCGILYQRSLTEPLTLLRDVIFEKVNVMKTLFFGDRLPFEMQFGDIFARLAVMFEIPCGILHKCSFTEPLI